MGDPSVLRLLPASSAAVPIDWSKVPEASKKFFLNGWGTNFFTWKKRRLPATIGDFAKMVNESKFFGYMEPQRCTLLLDISELGLTEPTASRNPGEGLPVGPHFYMKYLSEIWFVLFVPGKRDGIIGYSPNIPYVDEEDEKEEQEKENEEHENEEVEDEEEEDKAEQKEDDDDEYEEVEYEEEQSEQAKRDKKIAEDYEPRLCEELSRWGILGAMARKKVAGWEASTLKGRLETAQLTDAIMTLPRDHPAHRAMMADFLASLRSR